MENELLVDTRKSPFARLKPLRLSNVRLQGGFWGRWMEQNRKSTLPSQYTLLENTGRLDNFRRAAGHPEMPFQGYFFTDTCTVPSGAGAPMETHKPAA